MRSFKVQVFRTLLSLLPNRLALRVEFLVRVGYRLNIDNPVTFNEKIQRRKSKWKNSLFVICSDKLRVRDFIRDKVGTSYLIPLVFEGNSIELIKVDELLKAHASIMLKVSNDQGSVVKVRAIDSKEERQKAVDFISSRLESASNFGLLRNESWYSKSPAKVLAEVDLTAGDGILEDFKVHNFKQGDSTYQVLAVDYARGSGERSRTYYDHNLDVLPISNSSFNNNRFDCPLTKEDAELLFGLAKELSNPFSYVRVDFFFVRGQAFVGELTFAPGSGFSKFDSYETDKLMGQFWHGDPEE